MKLFVLFTLFASSFALDSATVDNAKADILAWLKNGGPPQKIVRLSMRILKYSSNTLRLKLFSCNPL